MVNLLGGTKFENGFLTSMNSNSVANTMGSSWNELIASTAFDAWGLYISLRANGNVDFLVDIGIGASSSEQILVPKLTAHMESNSFLGDGFFIPCNVPKGSRLSARAQSTTGTQSIWVSVIPIASDALNPGAFGIIDVYGVNLADSGGVSVDPGASINTKGGWSEIAASLTRPICWMVINIGNQNNASRTSLEWRLDIGEGAGGSETVLIPDLVISTNSIHDCIIPQHISLPCSLAAGTRIAARAQCAVSDATDRLFDVHIQGVAA